MVMLIFIGACVAVFALGYLLGRRNDKIDIHRTPARPTEPPPFEAAIERIATDDIVRIPSPFLVEPVVEKTTRVRAKRKRKARK